MRYAIAPFRLGETLGPNLRVLHDMIHCADEALGLHESSNSSNPAAAIYAKIPLYPPFSKGGILLPSLKRSLLIPLPLFEKEGPGEICSDRRTPDIATQFPWEKITSTNVLSYPSRYKDCAFRYNIFLRSSSGTPCNERSTNFHESGYVDAMCG